MKMFIFTNYFRIDYTDVMTGMTNLAADMKTDFPKIFR